MKGEIFSISPFFDPYQNLFQYSINNCETALLRHQHVPISSQLTYMTQSCLFRPEKNQKHFIPIMHWKFKTLYPGCFWYMKFVFQHSSSVKEIFKHLKKFTENHRTNNKHSTKNFYTPERWVPKIGQVSGALFDFLNCFI